MMDFSFNIAGYNIKGWMVAVALPILSSIAGGVYWSYDTLQRFYGVEKGIQLVAVKSKAFDAKADELTTLITSVETKAQREIATVNAGLNIDLQEINNTLNSKMLSLNALAVTELQSLEASLTSLIQNLEASTNTNNKGLDARLTSRIQTLEQAILDNDVRGLNEKLAKLSTNMTQILEQQKVLLDLRSQVDKATTITDGLGNTLDTLETEVNDIWKAYDELVDNPL